jgi:hypothetical protein
MIDFAFSNTVTHARKEVQLDNEYCCDHVPKSAETSRECKVTILWNQQGQTDKIIPNKPDVITVITKKGTCVLIYVAISGDRNVIKKEAEKILKF